EFDPQSWVIPRLEGKAKAAMLEVAFDEYGCGRAEHIHATLFRNSMEALGLDGRYGAYLDRVPGLNLARANLMTMFGLHRRLVGASVGHLAIGELTSSLSTKKAADGLRRLGYGPDATHFFDVHVLADSIHDMITLHDLAGEMAAGDPGMAEFIVFGAAAGAGLDGIFAEYLLGCWDRNEPSLRPEGG
ncbi:MAG TPA: iron-containing redox enzyme family protein, partial [Acidimicrobiales bacterium]|nr:iron-containing redox enzyme family protein [Acidimicrobiales bacterium]